MTVNGRVISAGEQMVLEIINFLIKIYNLIIYQVEQIIQVKYIYMHINEWKCSDKLISP